MSKTAAAMLEWRGKQKRGAIMEPETFEKIVKDAMKKYGISRERAEKVAGSAYWKSAEAKYKKGGGGE